MNEAVTLEDYIDRLNGQLQEAAAKLRNILDSELPTADGLLWENRPTWVANRVPLAAFEATGSSLTFIIFRGDEITDSTGTLKHDDAGQATLRIMSEQDIDEDLFLGWLHQVQETEG